jgi:hypothetical protein
MKKFFILLFILSFSCQYAFNLNGENKPTEKPVLQIKKIDKPLELTGKLENPIWQQATPIELNYEIRPGDNIQAPEKTFVRALYDDKHIYFGFECFDSNPAQIRANVTDRDRMFEDDYVIIVLDTYGDYQKGYEFAVNPYGIKGDLLATLNNEDASLDLIWHSAASINGNGWTAEIAIPFSSLTFPDKEDQNWVVGIVRNLPRSSRIQISWTKIDRNIPSFLPQSGLLEGLKNIKPGSNLEFLPYAIGQKGGQLENFNDPKSGIKYSPFEGRFGGGIKYAPSPNFSLDAVINPDFSQIESDAAQISVNTTFALYYDEKRPFFLIGNELLQTPMYYSRSINDPLGAARIIGKSGSLSFMYMSAYDRNTVIVVPGEDRSNTIPTDINSLANIGRLRYDMGDENYIGSMILTRNFEGGHNYLFGFDWNYKFWGNWYFNGEGFYSLTKEIDNTSLFSSPRQFGNTGKNAAFNGEEYSGNGIHLVLSHSQRAYNFSFVFNNFSPTYQTYNGLFSSNNYRQLYLSNEYVLYPQNSFIDRATFGLQGELRFNFDGVKKEQSLYPYLTFNLKGQTSIYAHFILVNDENFFGTDLKNVRRFYAEMNTRPIKELSLYAGGNFGRFIYRTSSPVIGTGHTIDLSLTIRPTSKLNLSLAYSRARLSNEKSGNLIYDGNIFRTVGTYQFSPEIFFRTILQYDSFSKSMQVYPLFSYKLNAFTTFFAGATSDYIDYKGDIGIANTSQQYFVKIQYLLGI